MRRRIEIRPTPDRPGGAAYGVSIPDDVRFRGFFPSGFEGARGWFHELAHAVHMKEIREHRRPFRFLPHERALSEGIGEIFAAVVRESAWVEQEFPDLDEEQRLGYLAATRAVDAYAVRTYCHPTRFELAMYQHEADRIDLAVLHRETFGTPPAHRPAYGLYVYLGRPLYVWDSLMSQAVTTIFIERLGAAPIRSRTVGDLLRDTLLAPGARLELKDYLAPTDGP